MNFIKPLTIGKLNLKNNILAAPLSGITENVFRQMMIEHGVGLVCSELISVAGLSRRDKKTFKMLNITEAERPIAVQLFGHKPQEFSEATKIASTEAASDIIDINMGCPVKKVVSAGAGVALMKDLKLARQIISAVVAATNLPVTVKFRLGWSAETINFLELGHICQEEGVAAVVLHPRTRAQFFLGHSDWTQIAELKKSLKIPVIGNGDICSWQEAQTMLATTGCDGVMVGRGLMGNPWLLTQILNQDDLAVSTEEKIKMYLEHTRRYLAFYPDFAPAKALGEMRKFAHRYINGFAGAVELRRQINLICDFQELTDLFASFF